MKPLRRLVAALYDLFTEQDVPAMTHKIRADKPQAENAEASFMTETVAAESEEHALFSKKFGKPTPSGVVCRRCGATGHIAANCRTDWDKIQKKRSPQYAGFSMTEEDSDNEAESDGKTIVEYINPDIHF